MNEDHRNALELLSLPDDILTPDERSWLSLHLEACQSCRRAESALRTIAETIADEAGAPVELLTRTRAGISERIAERQHARAAERIAFAVAALTTVLVCGYALLARWALPHLGYAGVFSPAIYWAIFASVCTLCSLATLGAALAVTARPLEGESVSGGAGGGR
jgi:anti-sigma factor RsiW